MKKSKPHNMLKLIDLESAQRMTGIDQVPPGTNIRNDVPDIDFESPGSFFDTDGDEDDGPQIFPMLGVEPCPVKNEGVSHIDDRTFSGWRKFSIPGKDFSQTPVEFMVVTSTVDDPMFHIRVGVMKLKGAEKIAEECIEYCRLIDSEKNSLLHPLRGRTLVYRDWMRIKMCWHRAVESEKPKPLPKKPKAYEEMTIREIEEACKKFRFYCQLNPYNSCSAEGQWIRAKTYHPDAHLDFTRLKKYLAGDPSALPAPDLTADYWGK